MQDNICYIVVSIIYISEVLKKIDNPMVGILVFAKGPSNRKHKKAHKNPKCKKQKTHSSYL